jgi:hypothetical protein
MRRVRPMVAALIGLVGASRGQAFAAGPTPERAGSDVRPEGPAAQSVGFTLLAGLALPVCTGQSGSCDGSPGAAPSLEALVLYEPNGRWAFGVVGQLARVHWRQTYLGMVAGAPPGIVESDLTSGFAGLAARFTPLPTRVVTPIIQLAVGSAFQMQTGSNFDCNGGVIPTGQLELGGRARVTSSFSLFAVASASGGIKGGCGVDDGAPATPFVGWGYGLRAGASFDITVGRASSEGAIAAR